MIRYSFWFLRLYLYIKLSNDISTPRHWRLCGLAACTQNKSLSFISILRSCLVPVSLQSLPVLAPVVPSSMTVDLGIQCIECNVMLG
jgi:hypothetical protein